jgi:hypothetical protein
MPASKSPFSIETLRRKLRAISGLLQDRAATASEKENAEAAKARLESQLKEAGAPAGDWTDTAFRLGRKVGDIARSTAPPAPKGDVTDHAFRAGRLLARSLKKWRAP